MMAIKTLKDLLKEKPYFSTIVPLSYTIVLKESENKPLIIRYAEGFKHALENLPVIIRPDELIVGTFDENVPVVIPRPEGTGLKILPELDFLDKRSVNPISTNKDAINKMKNVIAPYWKNYQIEDYATKLAPKRIFDVFHNVSAYIPTETGGIAHAVIDYASILSMGLKNYLDLTEHKLKEISQKETKEYKDKRDFYEAIKITIKALIQFSLLYGEKAKILSEKEINETRKKELIKIEEVCNNIANNPPSNFHEAVQLIWFIHLGLHIENFEHGISFGRLDQYLMPFYQNDKEEALRLIKNLFQKTNEIVALYDSATTEFFGGMATTQSVIVGGVNCEGIDATNDLTYLIITAIKENSLPSPNLNVRFHEQSPDELYQMISDVIAKGGNILGLMNDSPIIKGLTECGLTLEEARNFGIVGCVGLSSSGLSFDNTGAIFFNLAKPLEVVLGTDKTNTIDYLINKSDPALYTSMADIIKAYKKALFELIEMATIAANCFQEAHKKLKPTPLMSLCISGCFDNGSDVNCGSAQYNYSGIHVTGFPDVIDSLAAIEWAVFKERKVSLSELINALSKNFRGFDELHSLLLNKAPKYGLDNKDVDRYAQLVGKLLSESVKGLKCARGGNYRIGIHAMTTNVGFGVNTGALPSGRKSRKPLTKDVAPSSLGDKSLTSAINSATKLDHFLLNNGLACTLNITPEIVEKDNGRIFKALIQSYFNQGGMHLQFNSITPSMLKEAQKSPENYINLMVRVSGFSARFIDLPKSVQNEIILNYLYNKVN